MTSQPIQSPIVGLWRPGTHLKHLYYGPGCVEKHLTSVLPSIHSRVFIVTGTSIRNKTPLIQLLQNTLGERYQGIYSGIQEHNPEEKLEELCQVVAEYRAIDTLLAIGGGSPIDAAKIVSIRLKKSQNRIMTLITIPTTLSAAECAPGGGFLTRNGSKAGLMGSEMGVSAIFYDACFVRYTPLRLWLATGIRAVDHAVESMYHPQAGPVPWQALATWAFSILVMNLPLAKDIHGMALEAAHDINTQLQLAAFATSGFRGADFGGSMGLSHSLGQAIGGPYGIPHGETSCLTLAPVIRLKANTDREAAQQISRLLSGIGKHPTGDHQGDALAVAQLIKDLVADLDLNQPPLSKKVGRDQALVIAKRATKDTPSDDIVKLVESLF